MQARKSLSDFLPELRPPSLPPQSIGRANDRHAQLDAELKGLQTSLRELESFLKWLQEAETTVNVLADASQREDASQDSAHSKELRRQLEVRRWHGRGARGCV